MKDDDAASPNSDHLRQEIVEEINQPDAEQILRVEIVLDGRANGTVKARFPFTTSRPALNASMMRYAAGLLEREAEIWDLRATRPASGPVFVSQTGLEAFIVSPGASEDGYDSPEQAALCEPRRLDERPTLVSVRRGGERSAEVEVDLGRHPADRIVYRCTRDEDCRWWVEGSRSWFHEAPEIVVFAKPHDSLGLYIDVHPDHGYQLIITGYDFASTHASHHQSLKKAQKHAAEKTGIADIDWQPWPGTD